MSDPTAPNIPADAPQDVKDFFECKGDKLVWKKGKVTWLTIKISDDVEVTPDVSFEHGKNGGVQISISLPGTGISGTVDASVNADGQLVVDNVSLALKLFKGKIDDAIKNINDWFKHNKKKLKPAVLKKGEVTLEKVNTTGAYAPPVIAPFNEDEDQSKPVPVSLPAAAVALTPGADEWDAALYTPAPEVPAADSSSGMSLPALLIGSFLVAIGLGLAFGLFFFGGGLGASSAPSLVAAVTPGPTPTSTPIATPTPTVTPTPSATPTPTLSAPPTASPSPSPTPTPTPAAATPTPNAAQPVLTALCMRVVHTALNQYISYIAWDMYWDDFNVEFFELTIKGANDGEPVTLVYDPQTKSWRGKIGLASAGSKEFVSLIAYLPDGTQFDVTDALIDYLTFGTFEVRYPQEDTFGECPAD